jgi:CheY-like chemotaxis protein
MFRLRLWLWLMWLDSPAASDDHREKLKAKPMLQATSTLSRAMACRPRLSGEVANARAAAADHRGMAKVLVVEDDPDIAALIAMRLRATHEVSFASDGIGAVAAARRGRPDLVLVDLGLPAGDGFFVMERLRALEETAGTPVVVVSATTLQTMRAAAFEAGAVALVPKPFSASTLLDAVQFALAG